MTASVVLRGAGPADVPVVHRLIAANLEAGHLLPRTVEDVARHAERFVVAEAEGEVVGCAELAPLSAQVAEVLTTETGSLGVRGATIDRWPAARQSDTVDVAGFPVRVKVSPGRIKVEHDDAARVAQRAGLPLREVLSLAEEAGRRTLRVVPDPLAEASSPGHPHPHDHDHDDLA